MLITFLSKACSISAVRKPKRWGGSIGRVPFDLMIACLIMCRNGDSIGIARHSFDVFCMTGEGATKLARVGRLRAVSMRPLVTSARQAWSATTMALMRIASMMALS